MINNSFSIKMSVSNICLLCLQHTDDLFKVYGKRGIELNAPNTLEEHFWFEVREADEKSICGKCWRTVQNFHDFYNAVKLNHQRQFIFDIKPTIVGASEYNEIVELLDTIKHEPSIDIENDIDDCTSDIPDTLHSPTSESRIEAEVNRATNLPTIKRRKSLRAQSSKTTLTQYKTDVHTVLLSTYFNMSCDLCDTLLPSFRVTMKHYKVIHKVKGYLICCGKKFFRLQHMLQHCQWHINPDSFKCDHCRKNFKSKQILRHHVNLCHAPGDEKVFSCNDCDKTFSKQQNLNMHTRTWHTLQSPVVVSKPRNNLHKEHEMIRKRFLMQCDLCGEPYSTFRDAELHHLKAHNQAGYLNCCDRKFFKLYRAVQHCFWHDDPESFNCSFCQTSFTDEISLLDHIRNVHSPEDEREFQCDICKKSFAKSYYLTWHLKVNHVKDENKKFECHICHKRFVIFPYLKGHIKRIHRDVHSHICEICAKPCKTRKLYEDHYITFHTNISQKVQCCKCGKWLKNKQSLNKHLFRHKSKTEKCAICGRVCSHMHALKAHIRYAHREASLECVVCGKMFKRQQVLKEHMAIHAGITDLYKCTFCTKTFRSSANMYSHRKRAHPVELGQKKASQNSFTSATTV